MRILIFTNRDLASNVNLNLLLPQLSAHVAHIFVSDKVGGKNGNPPEALRLLKFFEQTMLNDVLFPQLNAQNRPFQGQYLTFDELSKHYNIPVESLNDVKSPAVLDRIRAMAPDLILSVRFGRIFGNDFVRIPRLGVINLHSGRLPQYRGVLATFRALMNGDDSIGCTLHYIDDATIDTGGIIGFSHLPVDRSKSLFWHILNLYPASTALVLDTIGQILRGQSVPTHTQDSADAQYFTFPTAEEIAAFKAQGWSFVDVGEYEAVLKKYLI